MKNLRKEDIVGSPGHCVVGKVQRAHGIRGELFIYLFAKEAAWLELLKEISLVQVREGEEHCFSLPLKSKRLHKEGLILKSEEIKDRSQAEALKGAFFSIPESFLKTESETDFYLREILDFELRDGNGELIGKISGFGDNGAQDLLKVKTEEGEFTIPLVDEWIVKLDRPSRVLQITLPPGLLDPEFL